MQIRFTKMQGLGNDFVVLDQIRASVALSPELVRYLADRHFGVGCDQVLVVEPSTSPKAQFRYRIFNADGTEVEQCGNGARCFARYVHQQGYALGPLITVETLAGLLTLRLEANDQVTVDMGAPRFAPSQIPFIAEHQALTYRLEVLDQIVEAAVLSMGNPHAVLQVADICTADVERLGATIGRDPRFPRGVNVGFMELVDAAYIRLRVFERGAGETLACGSGACAAVVAGRIQCWLNETVKVDLPGGQLTITWVGEGAPVLMTGPVMRVFEGELSYEWPRP